MKQDDYEQVLKWLDEWQQEARHHGHCLGTLDDKIAAHRFKEQLGKARSILRAHIFKAENLSEWCETHERGFDTIEECQKCGKQR